MAGLVLLGGAPPLSVFCQMTLMHTIWFRQLAQVSTVGQSSCFLPPLAGERNSGSKWGVEQPRPHSKHSQAGLHSEWAPEPPAALSCAHCTSGAQRPVSLPAVPVQTGADTGLPAALQCCLQLYLGICPRSGSLREEWPSLERNVLGAAQEHRQGGLESP